MNPKRSLWLHVLLLFSLPSLLQAVSSDSLKNVLNEYRESQYPVKDEKLLSLHLDIAKQLVKERSTEEAISYYESALQWSDEVETFFQIHAELGYLYWVQDDHDRALEHSELARDHADESISHKYQADNYHRIAQLLVNFGQMDDAVESELMALRYSEEIKDSLAIAKCYAGLARIMWYSDKMEEALEYDVMAMRVIEKVGSQGRIYRAYSDVGSTYTEMGKLDSAMKYVQLARKVAREIDYAHGIYFTAAQLGEIYKTRKEYPEAVRHIQEAIQGFREEGRDMTLADVTFMLGETLAEQKQYKTAIDTLQSALRIAQAKTYQTLERDIFLALSDYHEQIQDFAKAYTFAKKYEALKDSLMNQDVQERMEKLEKQYNLEKKDMEITLLEQQHKLERRRLYLIGLGVGVIILTLILLLLDHRNKFQRQSRELLERNHQEIQAQHQRMNEKRQDWQFFSNIISQNIYNYIKGLNTQIKDIANQPKEIQEAEAPRLLQAVEEDITHVNEELYHLIAFIEAGIKDDKTEILDIRYVLRNARDMLPIDYQGVIRKIFYYDLPQIRANRYKMSLLFKHLMLHAIKNPGDEPLELHITSSIIEDDDPSLSINELIIRDNGGKIPEHLHERIFQLNQPITHSSNFHLAICQKIVKLYGGKIALLQEHSFGNTIRIEFPMDQVGVKTPIPQIH